MEKAPGISPGAFYALNVLLVERSLRGLLQEIAKRCL